METTAHSGLSTQPIHSFSKIAGHPFLVVGEESLGNYLQQEIKTVTLNEEKNPGI